MESKEQMPEQEDKGQDQQEEHGEKSDKDLNDLLQEIRVLLQGVQVMTAFLVILPFSQGFDKLIEVQKWVYIATFICSMAGLILFSAPAAHHRLSRPLMDREKFKNFSTRMIIIGLIPSSLALVLATQLVVSQVIGNIASLIIAGIIALLIGIVWWVLPLAQKQK